MLETCAILTTPPNALVVEVHDRMPAILHEEDYDRWLDPGITDARRVEDCLKPFDPELMKNYPVSDRVNRRKMTMKIAPGNTTRPCSPEFIRFSVQSIVERGTLIAEMPSLRYVGTTS